MENIVETYHKNLIQQDKVISFITAGRATFTLKSLRNGKWFTYKSEFVEEFGKQKLVVRLLNGSDNTHNYTYLCTIKANDGIASIHRENSKISKDAPSFIFFSLAFQKLLVGLEIPDLEVWHEGRCCRCGRKLTVPESIENGIGPECAGRRQMFEI